jgi:Skp family chaperone for outer membrane proteins
LSIFLLAGSATAQQPVGPAGARPPVGGPPPYAAPQAVAPQGSQPLYTSVAIVDIGYIFKNYPIFDQEMKQLKAAFDQADQETQAEQRKLQTQKEALAQFAQTSPEYKKREEDLSRAVAELQITVNGKKKTLAEQEAGIYFRVYKSVENEIAIFAQQNRIDLVFRFSSDEMKSDNPNSIMQGVSKPIVYYNRGNDITLAVLERLNRGQGPRSTGAGPSIGTANRPGPIVPVRPGTGPQPGMQR